MITLLNPRSARWKFRLPLSILSLGAELEGRYPYQIVDGNFESDAETVLAQRIEASDTRYLAITVMPGPQLGQAIPLTESLRRRFPELVVIWGGYFPSLHTDVVLESGLVDYVIRGPGATSFRKLIDALEAGDSLEAVPGLSYRSGGTLVHNPGLGRDRAEAERPIPYHRIDVGRYVSDTCLGSRTLSYHSSYGCPFLCGFCAVAGVYKGAWSGRSPEDVAHDVEALHRNHGINALEFIDNNFFVGEQRTAEIAERIAPLGLGWWGEARPDTVMGYSDTTWRTMADSGLKMMFFGVESSSFDVLESMGKGGTQTPEMVLDLAARSRRFGIVPEFSFVIGTPSKDVGRSIGEDIRYIRTLVSGTRCDSRRQLIGTIEWHSAIFRFEPGTLLAVRGVIQWRMNSGQTVFSQVMDYAPRYEFQKCVARYRGDYQQKGFSCWEFLAMAFAQLIYRESLRDIEACLRALGRKRYHMGFRSKVARTTLATPTSGATGGCGFAQVDRHGAAVICRRPHRNQGLYALDSTTIDLTIPMGPSRGQDGWIFTATFPRLSTTDGKVHDVNG